MVPALERTDPHADAAARALAAVPVGQWTARLDHCVTHGQGPAALEEMVAGATDVPRWVKWSEVERAGMVLRRSGLLGGLVLGFRSLVYGYAAPAGNKPLMFSGRLVADTPRRLAETARFVAAVGRPEGMRPGGEGFRASLKVRLMHARVRTLLLDDPRWVRSRWAVPINQHDMVATLLLFSVVYLQGLERLGAVFTRAEREAYVHLWDWVGHVIGVESSLRLGDAGHAAELGEFIRATQHPPDGDARALVQALLQPPRPEGWVAGADRRLDAQLRARHRLAESICREMTDPQTADGLELGRGPLGHAVDGVRSVVGTLAWVRARSPALEELALRRGERYWREEVGRSLAGRPVTFTPPAGLASHPR